MNKIILSIMLVLCVSMVMAARPNVTKPTNVVPVEQVLVVNNRTIQNISVGTDGVVKNNMPPIPKGDTYDLSTPQTDTKTIDTIVEDEDQPVPKVEKLYTRPSFWTFYWLWPPNWFKHYVPKDVDPNNGIIVTPRNPNGPR